MCDTVLKNVLGFFLLFFVWCGISFFFFFLGGGGFGGDIEI